MTELDSLTQAIAALEAQRPHLGDALVDAMLAPARAQLAALQAPAPLVAPPPAPAQRKLVTILFADVSGFTALAETLDAEDVAATMNALWHRLDAAIREHGGKIDKHIGDAVMALWGTENAREDDAEQATLAALTMQAEVQHFAQAHSQALQLRIGLNTGPALLGAVGSTNEFTAMGDTVNVASRLEHAAPVGGILIAHATYRQVRGVFDVLAQPPLPVKGKSEPLQTYLVQRAKPRAFRMAGRGVEGVATHLVGRAAELAQLQAAFQEVTEQRTTRVLTVVAEAGLGKSRLLQEFLHWAELSETPVYLFRGRATPSTSDAPYALLRDLLAFRFDIQEGDPLETARAKLETGLTALCPADPQMQEKAHFIGHLAGWDFSASPYLRGLVGDAVQIRAIALHFLMRVFAALAAERPVVLCLEDVQWADHGSLDALRHLLGNVPPATPLLVIANARPTLFERVPDWQLTAQTRLDLRPLSETESTALVTDILRHVAELPPALRELIVQQAEGNPFYVEELIKMLIDEKVIEPGATAWQVQNARLATLRVPPTLTGVLQARLDGLPPAERLVLQRAAVLGRIFWDTAVQALGGEGMALAEVQTRLAAAQQRELVFQRTTLFAEAREYRFKHTLLRDVAYETVLKRERATYHARAAQWLETASGARRNEYLAQIAEHYEKAGQTAPAALCFEQAGDQAMQVSAFAEAVRFYRHIPAPAAPLALKLAEAHYRLGDYPAAHAALEQAQAAAATEVDRAAALALRGELTSEMGDYAAVQMILAEAVPLARASGDQLTLCRALYALGDVSWRLGKLEAAKVALDESLTLARTLGDLTRELFALNRLGAISWGRQALTEAEQLFTEVYARAVAAGNRERALGALNNLGVVAETRKDYAVQRAYIRQALALARELGMQQAIAKFLINLAGVEIAFGELATTRAHLREGLSLAHQRASPQEVAAVIAFGLLAHAEGQITRALALLGLARRHPAWDNENQQGLNATLAGWALDPAEVEAGLAQGAALDWDATVQALLQA